MDGTDEAQFMIAPAHGFGEFEAQNGVDQQFRQNGHGVFALFFFGSENVFTALHLFDGDVLFREAFGTKESLQRFGGVAFGVESRFFGGAFQLFFQIGLAFGETVHKEGQTAGRAHAADVFKVQTGFGKRFFGGFYEVGDAAGHKTGGDFLHPDFKQ